ncbi:MAG TPA: hypothetical protein VGP72_33305 [Planctomycetota bacterium]|jgi:hypothetical protein
MKIAELEKRLEEIIREFYPTVIVRQNLRVPNDGNDPVFDVFCVPDVKDGEFMEWSIEEYWKLAQQHNLPELDIMQHCISATREHYPEIWKEYTARTTRSRGTARPGRRKPVSQPAPPQKSKTSRR